MSPTYPDLVLVEMALDVVAPAIENILNQLAKRCALHVRVCYRDARNEIYGFPGLVNREFGDRPTWEYDYGEITRQKARATAESGLTSRELHQMYPQLLEEGDGKYWGSAQRGNVIVACSGVEPEYDEAIANMVVAVLWAIMQVDAKT